MTPCIQSFWVAFATLVTATIQSDDVFFDGCVSFRNGHAFGVLDWWES